MELKEFAARQAKIAPRRRLEAGALPETCVGKMYVLAGRICQFAKVTYVIEVGDAFGAPLVNHLNGAVFLGLLPAQATQATEASSPDVRVIKIDFNQLINLDDDILKQSLIVWPSIDRHLDAFPNMAGPMARWLSIVPYAIVSHSSAMPPMPVSGQPSGSAVGDGLAAAFEGYLARVNASNFMLGKTTGASDTTPYGVAVGGTHAIYRPTKRVNVLAIISCFNDADIVLDVVRHLIGEGVKMHFIDNWSTDGTWEMLQQLAETMPEHVVALERYPNAAKDVHYNWYEILQRKEDIAAEAPYDWFIHYDSDELRTSCWRSVPMADALGYIDSLGYNAINHFVLEFRPTKDGFSASDDAKTFFDHFEFNAIDANANQLKAWKKQPGIVLLAPSGGHIAQFPNQRVFPLCFLLAHYSLRSTVQARKKIYTDRLPRVIKESSKRRYHGHYRKYTEDKWVLSSFIWDEASLLKFDREAFFSDYFIQRLSGS